MGVSGAARKAMRRAISRSVRMPIGRCEASTTIAQVTFSFASRSTTSEQRALGRTTRTSVAGRAKSRTSMAKTAVRERAPASRFRHGMLIHSIREKQPDKMVMISHNSLCRKEKLATSTKVGAPCSCSPFEQQSARGKGRIWHVRMHPECIALAARSPHHTTRISIRRRCIESWEMLWVDSFAGVGGCSRVRRMGRRRRKGGRGDALVAPSLAPAFRADAGKTHVHVSERTTR